MPPSESGRYKCWENPGDSESDPEIVDEEEFIDPLSQETVYL